MPVAPVSAPHQSLKDDVYKGYRIAAGTNVVPNIWAIHHDERLYPDPFTFNPERFVPADGSNLGPESLNEGHYGFGFGRRYAACHVFPPRMLTYACSAARVQASISLQSPFGSLSFACSGLSTSLRRMTLAASLSCLTRLLAATASLRKLHGKTASMTTDVV